MPIITIWNWDPGHGDNGKRNMSFLAAKLKRACFRFSELGLTDPKDVTVCLGGSALMSSLSDPLVIIVDLLYEKPERTLEIKRKLAERLGQVCRAYRQRFRLQTVEIFIRTFDPNTEACWIG